MSQVLLPSACWPDLQYFYYLFKNDEPVIEINDTYKKQTCRNRYKILSANGVLVLTVPVKKHANHTKTSEIEISYSEDWQQRHWRAITSAYRNSPYFEFFEDELRLFYTAKTDLLYQYNHLQLRTLLRILKVRANITYTTSYQKEIPAEIDKRALLLNKQFSADPSSEVSLCLKTPYYQTFGDKHGFVPNLSILDLLFNEGLRAKEYLL